MTDILKLEVQVFFTHLLEQGVAWNTVKKVRYYLSGVYSKAIKLDCGVKSNPVSTVDLGTAPEHVEQVLLTYEQVAAIEDGIEDPTQRTFWWLVSVTGIRSGEARALRRNSIDWEHGKLKITESLFEGKVVMPKSRKGIRAIDLSQHQLQRLAGYCRLHPWASENDFLFPGKNGGGEAPLCTKRLMKKVIKPLASKLGIPNIGWHLLRHWNSTTMDGEKFSTMVRPKRLAHASPLVTNEHYTHVRDAVSRQAVEDIDRRLEESGKLEKPADSFGADAGTLEEVGV